MKTNYEEMLELFDRLCVRYRVESLVTLDKEFLKKIILDDYGRGYAGFGLEFYFTPDGEFTDYAVGE